MKPQTISKSSTAEFANRVISDLKEANSRLAQLKVSVQDNIKLKDSLRNCLKLYVAYLIEVHDITLQHDFGKNERDLIVSIEEEVRQDNSEGIWYYS